MRDVENFYKAKRLLGILDLKLLKRGALLAQDPTNLSEPEDELTPNANLAAHGDNPAHNGSLADAEITANSSLLTKKEKTRTHTESGALKREEATTLNGLSKGMIVVLGTCAIGAIVQ